MVHGGSRPALRMLRVLQAQPLHPCHKPLQTSPSGAAKSWRRMPRSRWGRNLKGTKWNILPSFPCRPAPAAPPRAGGICGGAGAQEHGRGRGGGLPGSWPGGAGAGGLCRGWAVAHGLGAGRCATGGGREAGGLGRAHGLGAGRCAGGEGRRWAVCVSVCICIGCVCMLVNACDCA